MPRARSLGWAVSRAHACLAAAHPAPPPAPLSAPLPAPCSQAEEKDKPRAHLLFEDVFKELPRHLKVRASLSALPPPARSLARSRCWAQEQRAALEEHVRKYPDHYDLNAHHHH